MLNFYKKCFTIASYKRYAGGVRGNYFSKLLFYTIDHIILSILYFIEVIFAINQLFFHEEFSRHLNTVL